MTLTPDQAKAGWETRPLMNCLALLRNGLAKEQNKEGRGLPITRIETIASDRINPLKVGFVDGLTEDDIAKYQLEPGDILFSHINSEPQIGRTAIYEGTPSKLLHGMNLLLLRPSKSVDARFLNFALMYLRHSGTTLALASRAVGQSSINQGRLRTLQIPFPQIDEQRRIARLLSAVQHAIGRQERLIVLTVGLKNTLMHKLFTQGTCGEPLKQSEIGPVPKSWVESRLGTIARFSSGGTPSRDVSNYWAGGTIPWVKTTEIDYCTITTTEERITQTGLDNSSAKVLPAGTLLLAMYGQGITRGRVAILGIDAATNQACAAIRPHSEDEISTAFLYHFLEFHYEALRQRGHGANQMNLSMTLLKEFPVCYPKRDEQDRIVQALRALDTKVNIHQGYTTQLGTLFRSLLHQLMTAQVRVHELDLSPLDDLEVEAAEVS